MIIGDYVGVWEFSEREGWRRRANGVLKAICEGWGLVQLAEPYIVMRHRDDAVALEPPLEWFRLEFLE